MESFFLFASHTKERPTRLAMLPVYSGGMTLGTGGHFYSSFTALAADYSCEQVDVLLGGEAVNLHQELAAQYPSDAQAGLLLSGGSKFLSCAVALPPC